MQMINEKALNTALNVLLGEDKANIVRGLYQVLNETEQRVRDEVADANCAMYEDGYKDGYDRGYAAAREAFYSPRQPEEASVMVGVGPDADDEAVARAIASLDGAPYQGDSGDEDRRE